MLILEIPEKNLSDEDVPVLKNVLAGFGDAMEYEFDSEKRIHKIFCSMLGEQLAIFTLGIRFQIVRHSINPDRKY